MREECWPGVMRCEIVRELGGGGDISNETLAHAESCLDVCYRQLRAKLDVVHNAPLRLPGDAP